MGRKIKEDLINEVKRLTKRDSKNYNDLNIPDLVAVLKAIDPDIKIRLLSNPPYIQIESSI